VNAADSPRHPPSTPTHPPSAVVGLVARNARALAAAELISKTASLAIVIALSRTLPERDFGRYVVAVAVATLLGVLAEAGTGTYLIRAVARSRDVLETTTGHVFLLRLALGAAAVAAAISLAWLLDYERTTAVAVVLFTTAAALRMCGATFLSALQALERLGDVALIQAQQAVFGAAVIALTLALGGGLVAVSWATVGVAAITIPWCWLRLHAVWPRPISLGLAGLREALPVVVSFGGAVVFSTALAYLDSVLVHHYKGDDETGLYGAAQRLLLVLYVIPAVYSAALTRSISYLASADIGAASWLHARAISHLAVIAVPLGAAGLVCSQAVLETLYGTPYGEADVALAILLISLVFAFPTWIAVTTAYALGLERAVVGVLGCAVAVNLAANLVVIPLWGKEGAAAAALAAEALTAFLLLWLLARRGVESRVPVALGKPLLAIVPAIVLVLALADVAPLPVRLAGGAAIYAAGLLALRTFDARDYEFLRALVGLRSGRIGIPFDR
jgi:O-antigen/teichoic acid export membrane protein